MLEVINPKTYRAVQLLSVEHVYAVYYDDKPCTIRLYNHYYDVPTKYRKTTHSSRGQALAQQRKLNKYFDTDKFSVVELTPSKTIIAK